jgi:hypothetical protein
MSSDDYFELVMKEAKDSPGCKTDSTSTPEGDGGLTLCMRVGDLTAEGTR